ncbi:PP2C family protein-serine/threonine phosphatase [Streptomyces sp. NPDC090052]|uniref:PP2C family protein-serine/threonine phosphatase n=1 Tax=unclassified Streptomyces TaxID=2593676 RepID=UPI002257C550|nr:PP2C family protein-serine/threonine phosphatase [Streptomyces sp. NBC_01306]MCX4723933.1 serine/threonine-protein phosphatase [Streptomyces sp. NBC_01306]WSX44643.1 serine/threonine-protein phosphatase [Streptomyces sp. NBC_00963]
MPLARSLTRLLVERDTTRRERAAFLVFLLVVLAAIVGVESVTPGDLRVVLFASLVPLVGALVLSVLATAALATLAGISIAVSYPLFAPHEHNPGQMAVVLASTWTIGMLALLISRLGSQRQSLLERTRGAAEAVQLALLRPFPLRTKDFEAYGVYLAADEYARVGGDLYELIESPFGTRVLVADVRGKGLDAINAGAAVLSAFRVAGYEEPGLSDLTRRMENILDRYNVYAETIGQEPRHVTALLVEFAPDRQRMRLVNCGHLEPFAVSGSGARQVALGEAGLPLGLGFLVPDEERARAVVETRLPYGDRLLLFTDGVTEARDGHRVFYPLARRLEGWTGLEPAALVREIEQDLHRYVGGRLQDDAAIMVITAR